MLLTFPKTGLMLCPYIGILQERSTYLLDTDALDSEVSGVLDQVQNGCGRVICYGSKEFSKTERNYCVTRCELLAAITFISEYQHYLLEHSFNLRTDHGCLRWIQRAAWPICLFNL